MSVEAGLLQRLATLTEVHERLPDVSPAILSTIFLADLFDER